MSQRSGEAVDGPTRLIGIRFDQQRTNTPFHVRIKASDWNPQERFLGWFETAEAAYETADRALVGRYLRLGRPRLVLNKPAKQPMYIREELTKLYMVDMPNETARRGSPPRYWFLVQDEFDLLLDELMVIKEGAVAAAAAAAETLEEGVLAAAAAAEGVAATAYQEEIGNR